MKRLKAEPYVVVAGQWPGVAKYLDEANETKSASARKDRQGYPPT